MISVCSLANGSLLCIAAANGSTLWSLEIGGEVSSDLRFADGVIYTTTRNSTRKHLTEVVAIDTNKRYVGTYSESFVRNDLENILLVGIVQLNTLVLFTRVRS